MVVVLVVFSSDGGGSVIIDVVSVVAALTLSTYNGVSNLTSFDVCSDVFPLATCQYKCMDVAFAFRAYYYYYYYYY